MGESKFKKWINRQLLALDSQFHRVLVSCLFFTITMAALYTHLMVVPQEFRENQVVPFTIYAPVTFDYEDSQKLAELTGNLVEGQAIQRFDTSKKEVALADFESFQKDFDDLRRNLSRLKDDDQTSTELIDRLSKKFTIQQTVIDRFLHYDDDRLTKIFANASDQLTQDMDDGVTKTYIREMQQGHVGEMLARPELIYVFFLQPNVTEYNAPDLMEKRQTLARVTIEKGSVIVAEGGVVTRSVQEQLNALEPYLKEQNSFRYIGLAFLVLVVIGFWYLYLRRFKRELLKTSNLVQLSGLFLLFLIVGLLIGRLPFSFFYYAVTFAVVALAAIVVLVYDAVFALYFSLGLALVLSVALGFGANLAMYLMGGALLPPVMLSAGCSRRQQVVFMLAVSILNIVLAISVILVSVQPLHWQVFAIAALAGFLAAVLSLGMLPVVETLTAQLTPGKLTELANPENDLLRQLKREAHGTYVHSEMVADLTEEACKEIGADWLLAKVGALYHDIGKLKRPGFFAENIHDKGKNPHMQLPPETSVKILRDHVVDGLQMAREHKLPVELHQFIATHHGSYTIRYFFHKAKVQHDEAPEEHAVPKQDRFTYNGPTPQNRESAVVMLADVTEAVVRAQSLMEQEEIEAAVDKVITDKLQDSQLVDSGLTVGDLKGIKTAFCRILFAQRHSRVRYPEDKTPPVQFQFADGSTKPS